MHGDILTIHKRRATASGKNREERGETITRGRRPLIALSDAKHIAEKRGEVRHEPDMICSFVICIVGLVAHVRIHRAGRIRITPAWLEREAADDLRALRFIASSPEISRELWIYTPKGTFRFFRVLENSLAEIDRNGQLLPDQPPVPKRRKRQAAPAPGGKTGDPGSAPGPAGSAVNVPIFLLPAGTPEPVDPLTVSVEENTDPASKGWDGE
jgi:hypothetical protein